MIIDDDDQPDGKAVLESERGGGGGGVQNGEGDDLVFLSSIKRTLPASRAVPN